MFEVIEKTVRLANFNPRTELNGEARRPAADLNVSAQFHKSALDDLLPGLAAMLYAPVAADSADLADQGAEDQNVALRMPLLGYPMDWNLVLENWTLTIDYGLGDKSNLVLPEARLHKFKITPQFGGTFLATWQISVHPDEKQAGWLYDHQAQDIVITLSKPEEAQGDLLAPRKPTKAEKAAAAKAELESHFTPSE